MKTTSKQIKTTILSISLLTVMAGAAVAPALGVIKEHFSTTPDILVKLIISIPALFIIITNLVFKYLCRFMRTKTIAVIGLIIYIVAGTCALFANNIWILLAFRAVLGVSVGLLMPLSTRIVGFLLSSRTAIGTDGRSCSNESIGRRSGNIACRTSCFCIVATEFFGVSFRANFDYIGIDAFAKR